MEKLFFAAVIVFAVLWLLTRPARRRRAVSAGDRRRRKAHNSRHISYSGFETSEDHRGRRKVHANEKHGKHACSANCKFCKAGGDYQSQLRVFDDRPIRGRRNRREVLRGDDED